MKNFTLTGYILLVLKQSTLACPVTSLRACDVYRALELYDIDNNLQVHEKGSTLKELI